MIAWVDASAGIAGDMLLGALVDAGAEIGVVQAAIDSVLPAAVRLAATPVSRAGLRATRAIVEVLAADQAARPWSNLRVRLASADLPEGVRAASIAVFQRLAEAEAYVHGMPVAEVHFHEVGAVDSIADIVGVCAALDDLGVTTLSGGPIAVGSGRMHAAHGDLPIPGPAVTELVRGWPVTAGGAGELATPTGVALLVALSTGCRDLPAMTIAAVGVGAGSRDVEGRANITRVLLGTPQSARRAEDDGDGDGADALLLETNIDDLDPRVWPGVLDALLRAGADDAWLVPVVMKKGRPGHTLTVLAPRQAAAALRAVMIDHTTSFGVRQSATRKFAMRRGWLDVDVDGAALPIKIAYRGELITRATPEFDMVAALAESRGLPALDVLQHAHAAASAAGLRAGAPLPVGLRPNLDRDDRSIQP